MRRTRLTIRMRAGLLRIVPDASWEIEHLNGHHFTLTLELKPSGEGTEVCWRQTFDTVERYQALANFVAAANQQISASDWPPRYCVNAGLHLLLGAFWISSIL